MNGKCMPYTHSTLLTSHTHIKCNCTRTSVIKCGFIDLQMVFNVKRSSYDLKPQFSGLLVDT